MPPSHNPHPVTALTLLAQIGGVAAVLLHWTVGLIVIPIILLPRWLPIVPGHAWTMIAQLSITTFCFGVVDGVSLEAMISYVAGGCEGAMPLMETYLLLLTIYHYF
jgi:hypothetical protein